MAGAFVEVTYNGTGRVERYLRDLIVVGENLEPAFAEIGEYLLESHSARFQLEVSPDGTPWEPLAPSTLSAKEDDRILQEEGTLRDTLHYQIAGDNMDFGTSLIYGAAQHFGYEDIPARPYLGIGTAPWNDEDEIVDILKGFLEP